MTHGISQKLTTEFKVQWSNLLSLGQELNRLKSSWRNNSAEISALERRITDILYQVLAITSSRHKTTWSDVELANSLEFIYILTDDRENTQKIRNIIYHEDYIEIAWIKLCRRDEMNILAWLINWTYFDKDSKTTFFNLEAAEEYARRTQWIWIPSNEDWKRIIASIPWNNAEEISINLRWLLNLNLGWILIWDDKPGLLIDWRMIFRKWTNWLYWSSDSILDKEEYFMFMDFVMHYIQKSWTLWNQLPLRCKFI